MAPPDLWKISASHGQNKIKDAVFYFLSFLSAKNIEDVGGSKNRFQ
jgi:hypothetical protein